MTGLRSSFALPHSLLYRSTPSPDASLAFVLACTGPNFCSERCVTNARALCPGTQDVVQQWSKFNNHAFYSAFPRPISSWAQDLRHMLLPYSAIETPAAHDPTIFVLKKKAWSMVTYRHQVIRVQSPLLIRNSVSFIHQQSGKCFFVLNSWRHCTRQVCRDACIHSCMAVGLFKMTWPFYLYIFFNVSLSTLFKISVLFHMRRS